MKPPESTRDRLVREWLAKAEEDLGVAERLAAGDTPYCAAVGFHAQQAAEKYLKGLLVEYQIEFPKTHDLDEILDLLASVNNSLAESLRHVIELTSYAIEIRYPSESPPVTPEEARRAVQLARSVRETVATSLRIHKK